MHDNKKIEVQGVFTHHPKADSVCVTADGQIFFTNSDAFAHAKNLDDKTIETVTRKEFFAETNTEEKGLTAQMSVEEIKEAVEKEENIEVLQEWLAGETQGKKRKTALEFIDARIKGLVAKQ
jgi:hypothetical protein